MRVRLGACRAWHRSPAAPDTPARRVIRIIRIIRSYGHTAAWHCATLPHLPGIEASPPAPPDRMFFYHSHAHPSILAWAQDCPLKPKNEMFFIRFEERFVIENADGSGAQLPGPEAVR